MRRGWGWGERLPLKEATSIQRLAFGALYVLGDQIIHGEGVCLNESKDTWL